MRKIIIIVLAIGLLSESKAQQLPLYSQYYFNTFILNPAHTGLERGTSIGLTARRQFTGLSNAIGTYAATLQSRGEENNAGFGVYFYNDNTNLFRTNSVTGSYAYHVDLDDKKKLSFGIGLSAIDNRFNANNFTLVDANDPVVQLLGAEGGISMDANLGVNLQLDRFSLGLANLQILQNRTAFSNNINQKAYYNLARHWMLTMGYKIPLNDEWEIEPYILYRKTQTAPGQTDVNVFVNWLNKGYAGLAYRDGMSFSTMVGFQLTNSITAGYAFDITTNALRNTLGNTHEIMLKFDLGKPQVAPAANTELMARNDEKISNLEKEIEALKKKSAESKTDTVVIEKVTYADRGNVKTPEKTTKPEVPKRTTPAAGQSQFYVIAGSFANQSAANTYIKSLKQKNISGFSKLDASNGRYYVHLGNFTTKEGAVDLINEMKPSGLALWVKEM